MVSESRWWFWVCVFSSAYRRKNIVVLVVDRLKAIQHCPCDFQKIKNCIFFLAAPSVAPDIEYADSKETQQEQSPAQVRIYF